MTRIDLDHAATTPVAAQVLDEMLPYLTTTQGNPSSVHHAGRAARAAVDAARDRLAAVLHCAQREIVFTGSGTEADNLALRGVIERWGSERGRHIVVGAIEHEAVLETARRLEETGAATLSIAACDRDGRVSPETIAAAVGGAPRPVPRYQASASARPATKRSLQALPGVSSRIATKHFCMSGS